MRKKLPGLILTLISLGLVLWLVVADLGNTNPGELAAPHAGIATLLGGPTCVECHGEKPEDLPAACLSCHQEVKRDIDKKFGLHGNIQTPGAMECRLCHSDHNGKSFQLVSDKSFALAGFEDIQAFDHSMFDFQLAGKHLEIDCNQCHQLAAASVLEEGQHRYMGLTQKCSSCHEDPHEGRLQEDCAKCHGQSKAFDLVATFEHNPRFPLSGVHGDVGCVECHAKDDLHSVESMGGLNPPQWRSCVDCHESPHAESFIAASYQALPKDEQTCAACHLLDHQDFLSARDFLSSEDHRASGFALEPPHKGLDCKQCHEESTVSNRTEAVLADFARRFPGRQAEDCSRCHKDPHAQQFEGNAIAANNCLSCHEGLKFLPSTFDRSRHAETGFVLDGAHAQAECADCHTDDEPDDELGPLYSAVETSCQSCHADVHDACFEEFALSNDVTSLDCNQCHTTASFQEVLAPGFDHERWTAFKLEGKHASNDCESCHPAFPVATTNGRTFGIAPQLQNRQQDSCESCHEDIHKHSFDRPGLPTTVNDRQSCARCHSQEQFLPLLVEPFDHGMWTQHELRGAHQQAKCSSCHAPDNPKLGETCSDCHADPHEQRFQGRGMPSSVNGKTDCARCHNEEKFLPLQGGDFDHVLWANYELRGAHARAECASCHKPDKPSLTALGNKCSDCHNDPHDQRFDGLNMPSIVNGKTDCARCHNEESFRDMRDAPFDHNKWTGFKLVDAHRFADCAACHGRNQLAHNNVEARSLGKVSERFPGSTDHCSTCHQNPHGNTFDRAGVPRTRNGKQDCARCHGQVSFRVAQHDFNHDRMTQFALEGAHATVDCSRCHRPIQRRGRDARSFDHAQGTSCQSCHADPHVGQFRNSKNSQCQDCHSVNGTFQTGLIFTHNSQSSYKLDGAHEDLKCSSCHIAYPLGNGRSAVRYRPLGTQCRDCHGLR